MKVTDAIDKARRSIVQIRVDASAPDRSTFDVRTVGTGFAVSDQGHIVTVKHVVDAAPDPRALRVGVAFPNVDEGPIQIQASFQITDAHVLDVDEANDLALMQFDPSQNVGISIGGQAPANMTPTPMPFHRGKVREGQELALSGYPLSQPSLVTTIGILASTYAPEAPGLPDRYLGDFTANGGNSGGPVYSLTDASMVGVCVAGRLAPVFGAEGHYAAGLTVIVPADAVRALLERNGLTPSLAVRPGAQAKRPSGRRR